MKLGYFLEPGERPNSNYRVIMPMLALKRHTFDPMWASKLTGSHCGCSCSAILWVHWHQLDRAGYVKRLAAHNVAISFDNDDEPESDNRYELGLRTPEVGRAQTIGEHEKVL